MYGSRIAVVAFGALGVVCAALVAFLVWVVWQDAQRPTFELKRDDWTCTQRETRIRPMGMMVGKTPVITPAVVTECTEWRRNARGATP